MRLKKVRIYGFKSFPDKTELDFNKNIVAIVGPNGCGKSNIVDAIYWIFQHYGLKDLRANEKQDLIFKGNSFKNKSGFAEVELVFKKENELEIEDNTFSIKKRVFQSGEINYFIDNKQVKYSDYEKFLLDNQISSPEYSIIAQGKVEKIISSKPEEKREIIEEAAGIKKYKKERKQALDKLAKANDNLQQLEILIEEVKSESEKLEDQAKKAELYKNTKKNLEKYEKLLYFVKYNNIKKQLQNLLEENKDFINKNQEIENESKELDNESERLKKIMEQKGQSITLFRENIIKIEGEISTNEQTIVFHRQRYDEIKSYIERAKENLTSNIQKLEQINELLSIDIEEDNNKLYNLEERKEEYQEKIAEIDSFIVKNEELLLDKRTVIKEKENLLKEYIQKENENINKQYTYINKIIYELENIYKLKKEKYKDVFELLNSIELNLKSKKTLFNDYIQFGSEEEYKKFKEKIGFFTKEFESLLNEYLDLKNNIQIIYEYSNKVENLFFAEDSIFKKREKLVSQIEKLSNEIDSLKDEVNLIDNEINEKIKAKEILKNELNEINVEISRLEEKIKNSNLQKEKLENDKFELEFNIKKINQEIENYKQKLKESEEKSKNNFENIDKLMQQKKEIEQNIKQMENEIDEYSSKLVELQKKYNEIFERKKALNERRNNFNKLKLKYESQIDTLRQIFFDTYREDLLEFKVEDEEIKSENFLRKEISRLSDVLNELGQVNLLALDEYEEVKKRYEFLNNQKEDVIKSINDLQVVIKKLEVHLNEKFYNAFLEIKENFKKIFKSIFRGGTAELYLVDKDNLLETGVDIKIQPPGKKISHLTLLSGGEKSMSAIALLFSLFLYRSSPFCIMDEVDAALDENNVLRYRQMIKDFSDKTQFIIISHNKITLEISDILYGVTMEQDGISKVVSAKLENVE